MYIYIWDLKAQALPPVVLFLAIMLNRLSIMRSTRLTFAINTCCNYHSHVESEIMRTTNDTCIGENQSVRHTMQRHDDFVFDMSSHGHTHASRCDLLSLLVYQ